MRLLYFGEDIEIEDKDRTLFLDPNNGIDNEIYHLIKKILNTFEDKDVYIDVGAFVGDTCLFINKGRCFAFEPSVRNFLYLVKNCKLNPNRKIIPSMVAISDKQERYEVVEFKDRVDGSGSEDYIELGKGNFETDTIDNLFKCTSSIKLIKTDTEGYDLKVLEGAKETIRIHRPIVILERECNRLSIDTEKDAIAFFENNKLRYETTLVGNNIVCKPK